MLLDEVYSGASTDELFRDVLREARQMGPMPSFLQVGYRHESGVLHRGLSLMKEMQYDVDVRIQQMEEDKAKCANAKEKAVRELTRKRNDTAAQITSANRDLKQAEDVLQEQQQEFETISKSSIKKKMMFEKMIGQAKVAINVTKRQVALIKHVVNVVHQMSAEYHNDTSNKKVDIGPVIKMLNDVLANLRTEIKLQNGKIKDNLQKQIEEENRKVESEGLSLQNATAEFNATSATHENRTTHLQLFVVQTDKELKALGLEISECQDEVTADARTHEQSKSVLQFIVEYFQALLKAETSAESAAAVNATNSSLSSLGGNSTGNSTDLAQSDSSVGTDDSSNAAQPLETKAVKQTPVDTTIAAPGSQVSYTNELHDVIAKK